LAQGVGLLLVARKAVEQEAVTGVAGVDPIADHLHDDLVGHQLARIHVALCLFSELRALCDLSTQDVAGGDVRQPEVLAQALGLGALAGARRTEQDEVEVGQDPGRLSAPTRRLRLARAPAAGAPASKKRPLGY